MCEVATSCDDLPVVIVTTLGRSTDARLCRATTVRDHLCKPFKQKELQDCLRRILQPGGVVERRPEAPVRHGPASSLKVLVAEDNPVNQMVVRRLLERDGHEVVVVSNGCSALMALELERFDVVLMDVQMPEMDGLEATRRQRTREQAGAPRTHVVAVTAHAMAGDRDRCFAAGADDYVTKPIQGAALRAALAAVPERVDEPAVT